MSGNRLGVLVFLVLAACGDDDSRPEDAGPADTPGDMPIDGPAFCYPRTGMSFPTGTTPSSVVVGLFDGDTNRDAIVMSATELAFFPGNGDGTFGAKVAIGTLTMAPPMWGARVLVAVDLNNNGALDLVHSAGTSIAVRMSNGNGTFSAPVLYAMGGNVVAIATGRLDVGLSNDIAVLEQAGEIDLLANPANDGVLVQGSPLTTVGGSGPGSLAIGEVSGDANLDIITGAVGAQFQNVYIYNGAGNLQFSSGSGRPAFGSPHGLAIGDVDKDGKGDILVSNSTGVNQASFLKGQANGGGFDAPVSLGTTGPDPANMLAGDFNGDTYLDVVTANYGNGSVGNISYLRSNGDGTFADPFNVSWCTSACETLGLAAGDLNGDSIDDVVAVNRAENTLQVMLTTCP